MLPNQPPRDYASVSHRDAIFSGDLFDANATLSHSSHSKNVRVVEDCFPVIFSFRRPNTKNLSGVPVIFLLSAIFKILRPVIRLISVFMIYAATFWARANKGVRNKTVYSISFLLLPMKDDAKVSATDCGLIKQPAYITLSSKSVIAAPPYVTRIGNFIQSFIACYRLPYLHYLVTSYA